MACLALNFTIGELKRKRLTEMLHQFVSRGLPGITELRRYARSASSSSGEIVRENGDRLACDILDISLDGASLKTEGRPAIGEVVALGRSLGRSSATIAMELPFNTSEKCRPRPMDCRVTIRRWHKA